MWYKKVGKSFFRFVTVHTFDRRTEIPWQYRAPHYMQSHGKNTFKTSFEQISTTLTTF